MLDPYLPSQQEVPGEHERLKTEGGAADAVSDDDELYGLARELGVDLDTARRIRAERRAQVGGKWEGWGGNGCVWGGGGGCRGVGGLGVVMLGVVRDSRCDVLRAHCRNLGADGFVSGV